VKLYTNKDGQVKLRINGGPVLANEHPVTKIVKWKVAVTLQHNMQKWWVY